MGERERESYEIPNSLYTVIILNSCTHNNNVILCRFHPLFIYLFLCFFLFSFLYYFILMILKMLDICLYIFVVVVLNLSTIFFSLFLLRAELNKWLYLYLFYFFYCRNKWDSKQTSEQYFINCSYISALIFFSFAFLPSIFIWYSIFWIWCSVEIQVKAFRNMKYRYIDTIKSNSDGDFFLYILDKLTDHSISTRKKRKEYKLEN